MTTEQKRAELAEAGEPWPKCECHHAPQTWNTDPRRLGGGRFVCRVEYQERRRARREIERGVWIPPATQAAIECLRGQYPWMDTLELLDELDRQRLMVRSGQLTRRSLVDNRDREFRHLPRNGEPECPPSFPRSTISNGSAAPRLASYVR